MEKLVIYVLVICIKFFNQRMMRSVASLLVEACFP